MLLLKFVVIVRALDGRPQAQELPPLFTRFDLRAA